MPDRRSAFGFALFLLLAAGAGGDVSAQAPPGATPPGEVRIQGIDRDQPAPAARTSAATIDLRESMRKFIQSISVYARGQKRDFAVVIEGGLEMLAKVDEADETKSYPARTYMRSIDAVLVEALNFGDPKPGQATLPERRAPKLTAVQLAKRNGLKVFAIDYTTSPAQSDQSYKTNAALGLIPFAAPKPMAEIDALPRHPKRPFAENPNSAISLASVKNFVAIGDSSPFGRQDEFALKVHDTNFDMVVVDVFHGRQPLTKQAVETLKYKKLGAKRLVMARVDIGSAASYQYFWKPDWREGDPVFVSAPHPRNPDRHYVEFWREEWQKIIAGDPNSYIFGVIAQGFDGAVLAGLDAVRYFETGGEETQPQ